MAKRRTTVGLDTSIVLRLLIGEPKLQALAARDFVAELIARGEATMVSDLVIAETYFALNAHYEVPKREAIKVLLQFLYSQYVLTEPQSNIFEVLEAAKSSSKPGLVDRIIHAQYSLYADSVATFDRNMGRLDGIHLLK